MEIKKMPPNTKDSRSDLIKNLTNSSRAVDKINIKVILNIFLLNGIIERFL